jgi:hypothetical protein
MGGGTAADARSDTAAGGGAGAQQPEPASPVRVPVAAGLHKWQLAREAAAVAAKRTLDILLKPGSWLFTSMERLPAMYRALAKLQANSDKPAVARLSPAAMVDALRREGLGAALRAAVRAGLLDPVSLQVDAVGLDALGHLMTRPAAARIAGGHLAPLVMWCCDACGRVRSSWWVISGAVAPSTPAGRSGASADGAGAPAQAAPASGAGGSAVTSVVPPSPQPAVNLPERYLNLYHAWWAAVAEARELVVAVAVDILQRRTEDRADLAVAEWLGQLAAAPGTAEDSLTDDRFLVSLRVNNLCHGPGCAAGLAASAQPVVQTSTHASATASRCQLGAGFANAALADDASRTARAQSVRNCIPVRPWRVSRLPAALATIAASTIAHIEPSEQAHGRLGQPTTVCNRAGCHGRQSATTHVESNASVTAWLQKLRAEIAQAWPPWRLSWQRHAHRQFSSCARHSWRRA